MRPSREGDEAEKVRDLLSSQSLFVRFSSTPRMLLLLLVSLRSVMLCHLNIRQAPIRDQPEGRGVANPNGEHDVQAPSLSIHLSLSY